MFKFNSSCSIPCAQRRAECIQELLMSNQCWSFEFSDFRILILKSEIWNPKSEIWGFRFHNSDFRFQISDFRFRNLKSEIWNLKSELWNLKPQISDFGFQISDFRIRILKSENSNDQHWLDINSSCMHSARRWAHGILQELLNLNNNGSIEISDFRFQISDFEI